MCSVNLVSDRAITVRRLQSVFSALFLSAVFLRLYPFIGAASFAAAGGIWVLLPCILFLWIPAYYRSSSLRYTDGAVMIEKGLIMRRRIRIPRQRIQYCTCCRTPLQRLFDICTVGFVCEGSFVAVFGADEKGAQVFTGLKH